MAAGRQPWYKAAWTIRKYLTVPNALSASRIVFLPLLYVFALKGMGIPFVVAYALLGATDILDGYLARRLNQTSEIGKVLDSWADLAMYVSTAFFMARLHMDYLRPNLTVPVRLLRPPGAFARRVGHQAAGNRSSCTRSCSRWTPCWSTS